MAKYYAPNFSGLLPLFDGKSAAGGKLYAYRAGSSIPAPLFDEDGTELGSWVSIDSNGCADFLLDSSLSYKLVVKDSLGAVAGEWDNVKATNAPGGMDNPMTAPGDIIVGGTGGTATALPVGANGEVLTSDGTTASWAAPAAQPGDHLVKASATDASDPGSLNDKIAVLSPVTKNTIITPQGDEKLLLGIGTSGVTDGYVLTKGMTGADWAAIPTQTGDHKVSADGTDTAGYLEDKLGEGSGISLAKSGGKIVFSVTGGGGGGGSAGAAVWAVHPNIATTQQVAADTSWKTSLHKIFVPKLTPSHVAFALASDAAHFAFTARVGIYTANRVLCYYGEASYASAPDYLGLNSSTGEFYSIPVSAVPTAPKTEFENEFVILAVSFPSYGSYRPSFLSYNAANSSVRKMTAPITSSMTTLPSPDGELLTRTCAVGIL